MTSPIVAYSDLIVGGVDASHVCRADHLTIGSGQVLGIDARTSAQGRHLLRVLATLERPEQGRYRFNGVPVGWRNVQQYLAIKRQIGYVAADAALISNRTVRENLLLGRYYYENDLSIDLDETVRHLCDATGLTDDLCQQRPSELSDAMFFKTITIREMAKKPRLMLIDRPENLLDVPEDDTLFIHLKSMIDSGMAVVFFSHSRKINALAQLRLVLNNEKIWIEDA